MNEGAGNDNCIEMRSTTMAQPTTGSSEVRLSSMVILMETNVYTPTDSPANK